MKPNQIAKIIQKLTGAQSLTLKKLGIKGFYPTQQLFNLTVDALEKMWLQSTAHEGLTDIVQNILKQHHLPDDYPLEMVVIFSGNVITIDYNGNGLQNYLQEIIDELKRLKVN